MLQVEFEKKMEFRPADHPLLYFFERGDLIKIQEDKLDLVDAMLSKGVNYGIVFGPSSSGKTFLARAIAKIYDFILVEW
jgi:ABC-type oligopeptide transport system ATPase subunit